MHRVLQSSSPVQQQMMANPNSWWNINSLRAPSPQQATSSSFFPNIPPYHHSNLFPQYMPTNPSSALAPSWLENSSQEHQQLQADSWGQLLLGGLVSEEDKNALTQLQAKRLENWGDQQVLEQSPVDVKQENSSSSYLYGHATREDFHGSKSAVWPTTTLTPAASPPKSCVTSFSSNLLDFSYNKSDGNKHPVPDQSSECKSSATGGAQKKARTQPSSAQSTTFKVRKEKLGDRITALHQLVSPFGKTDTASVLAEAIGYIRFLQNQIEALSLPYLGNGSGNMRHQQTVQRERNCIFPEDPGQLLNDNCMKRKGTLDQDTNHEEAKDLRSRGLCLVPIQCTMQVGNETGADYWAPAIGGGFH